jgi:hypothetical protein
MITSLVGGGVFTTLDNFILLEGKDSRCSGKFKK